MTKTLITTIDAFNSRGSITAWKESIEYLPGFIRFYSVTGHFHFLSNDAIIKMEDIEE